jgi:hypothetical protein
MEDMVNATISIELPDETACYGHVHANDIHAAFVNYIVGSDVPQRNGLSQGQTGVCLTVE